MVTQYTFEEAKIRVIRQVNRAESLLVKIIDSSFVHRTMRWNVTTRAMRTINKYGSLDQYLLNVRTKWLGERAMWLRCRLRDELHKKELEAAAENSGAERVIVKTELERAKEQLVTGMPV